MLAMMIVEVGCARKRTAVRSMRSISCSGVVADGSRDELIEIDDRPGHHLRVLGAEKRNEAGVKVERLLQKADGCAALFRRLGGGEGNGARERVIGP
jgi:hypothetical protein